MKNLKNIRIIFLLLILLSIPLVSFSAKDQRESKSRAAVSYTLNSFSVLSSSEQPKISGNRVVWTSSNAGPNRNLFLRDLTTGVTTQLTNDTKYFYNPDIDGDKVVWQESGTNKIWYRNLGSGTTIQLGIGWYPAVSGDRVVWWNYNLLGGVEMDGITLFNLANSTSTLLPNTAGYFWDLELEGTRLVISGGGIHYYNLSNSSRVKISNESSQETSEYGVISGDFIIWQKGDTSGNYSEIWKYQITTGSRVKISTQQRAFRPRIDQNRVVWIVPFEGNIGFYLYDLATSTERKIEPYASRHYEFLDVSQGKVIWLAYEGAFPYTEKIYIYEEGGTSPPPPPPPKIGDLDTDGDVDIFDLSSLITLWGSNNVNADLNDNGKVDIYDLSILLTNWGN